MPGIGCGANVAMGGGRQRSVKDLLPDGATSVILQLDLDDPRCVVTGSGLSTVWNQATTPLAHATQGTDANRPALGTGGLGGHRYAIGDGLAKHMALTGLADASSDFTVFAVIDQTSLSFNQQILFSLNNAYDACVTKNVGTNQVGLVDTTAWNDAVAAKTGAQVLTWRIDSTGPDFEVYRDGKLLGSAAYDGTVTCGPNATILSSVSGAPDFWADCDLYYLVVVNRVCTDAETAAINAWLMARFALTASMASIANLGAWWDLDHATQAGGVLTAVTDRALAQAINVVGAPAIVSVGGQDFVRFDGVDDVLWIADAAALDGAAGCTHVLKHANHEALPVNATLAQKGRSAVHLNGGIGGHGSAGTRLTAICNSGNDADVGPLVELATPAETIAIAIASGAAVRRVDGDGTYASTVTAQTTTVGAGSLTWGARETGASTFDEYTEVDARAAAYYNRPLNQYELIAAHAMLRDGP